MGGLCPAHIKLRVKLSVSTPQRHVKGEGMALLILNFGLCGAWSTSLPGVNTATHRIGGLMGPIAGLNLLKKAENALPLPAFETGIFQQTAWSQFHCAVFFNNRKTLRYLLHSVVNSSFFLFSFLIKEDG
jgi:hypothetical protein